MRVPLNCIFSVKCRVTIMGLLQSLSSTINHIVHTKNLTYVKRHYSNMQMQ